MLQKVLDPPEPETVEEALDLLVHIHALERPLTHRARYEPTFYGRLLDSLPLSFDASVLALKFGVIGLLREGILISTLMDIQPLPILKPFGNPTLVSFYHVLFYSYLALLFSVLPYHLFCRLQSMWTTISRAILTLIYKQERKKQ